MATRPFTDGAEIAAGQGACRIIRAGLVGYQEAWDWQVRIASGVRDGSQPETLLLLEHPHTYTRGRLAPDSDLLLDEATLAARGIAVVETDRGGLITYHGPGQLVAYPIIRLRRLLTKRRRPPLVRAHPGAGHHQRAGRVRPDRHHRRRDAPGSWTSDGQRKIAAIGVKIAGGVAYHGFAINVDPDLAMFDGIIPCGITDRAVTSMAAELGRAVDIEAMADCVARQFCGALDLAED